MRKSWLVCVCLGALAWGQAPVAPPAGNQAPPTGGPVLPHPTPEDTASLPADTPVLTINGVCKPKPAAAKTAAAGAKAATPPAKTPAADCKTVITKAEFERLASGVAPNMTPQLKRQLASVLPRLMAMSQAAEKKGLDKTPRYAETLKFAKMQILTNELQRNVQEEAAKVPPEDVEAYYKRNPEAYQQYNVDRLFIPRNKQQVDENAPEEDESKLTEEQQKAKEAEDKAKQEKGEQEMTKLAESLRERAAKGEDFITLQKEAFVAAGMKIESPTVSLPKVRRTGLPPGHAAIFDLKTGDISQLISDSGGHYVYKINSTELLTLDQVKDEIHGTLQNQRTRDGMEKYTGSFKVDTNEKYFGPAAGMHMPPPPHLPNPHLAPSPTAPAPQTQAPAPSSPAQTAAPKPN